MYAELIDQKISEVHQKGVATKILQSMDRIRNEFDPVQARRWPTELLQNARDLAYPQQPVRVQLELTDDAVYFRHSGKPFSVKDILSIVNQVSSKKPGEGVGKFGTGFMSTFQLSMTGRSSPFSSSGRMVLSWRQSGTKTGGSPPALQYAPAVHRLPAARSDSPSRWRSTACPCGPTSPAAASLWWSMSSPWTPEKTGP